MRPMTTETSLRVVKVTLKKLRDTQKIFKNKAEISKRL